MHDKPSQSIIDFCLYLVKNEEETSTLLSDIASNRKGKDDLTIMESVWERWADEEVAFNEFHFSETDWEIHHCLEFMRKPIRTSLFLYEHLGLTYANVAQVLSASTSTINIRIRKAREQLLEMFSEKLPSLQIESTSDLSNVVQAYFVHYLAHFKTPTISHKEANEETTPAVLTWNGNPIETMDKATESRIGKGIKSILYAVLLIVAVGSIGYLTRPVLKSGDVAARQISLLESFATTVTTRFTEFDEPKMVSDLVAQNFSNHVVVPLLDDHELVGLGEEVIPPSTRIPSVRFKTSSGVEEKIYVIDYAWLDAHPAYQLPDELFAELMEEDRYVEVPLQDTKAVVWRWRDDIYLAFPSGSTEEFASEIYPYSYEQETP